MAPSARSSIPAHTRVPPAVRQEPSSCSLSAERLRCVRPHVTGWGHGAQTTDLCGKGGKARREGERLLPLQLLLSAQGQDGCQDTGASLPTVSLPAGGLLRSPWARMPQPHPCSLCSLTSERHSLKLRRPPGCWVLFIQCVNHPVSRPCETQEPRVI